MRLFLGLSTELSLPRAPRPIIMLCLDWDNMRGTSDLAIISGDPRTGSSHISSMLLVMSLIIVSDWWPVVWPPVYPWLRALAWDSRLWTLLGAPVLILTTAPDDTGLCLLLCSSCILCLCLSLFTLCFTRSTGLTLVTGLDTAPPSLTTGLKWVLAMCWNTVSMLTLSLALVVTSSSSSDEASSSASYLQ